MILDTGTLEAWVADTCVIELYIPSLRSVAREGEQHRPGAVKKRRDQSAIAIKVESVGRDDQARSSCASFAKEPGFPSITSSIHLFILLP